MWEWFENGLSMAWFIVINLLEIEPWNIPPAARPLWSNGLELPLTLLIHHSSASNRQSQLQSNSGIYQTDHVHIVTQNIDSFHHQCVVHSIWCHTLGIELRKLVSLLDQVGGANSVCKHQTLATRQRGSHLSPGHDNLHFENRKDIFMSF